MSLIFLIFAIIYTIRRPKLKRLQPENFPDVSEETLFKWKHLELLSIDIFLWVTWGGFGLSIILQPLLRPIFASMSEPFSLDLALNGGFVVIFLAGLIVSAIYGSRAARIKKSVNIRWPKK